MKRPLSTVLSVLACVGAAFLAAPAAHAQGTFTPGTGTTANCNPGTGGTSYDTVSCSVGSVAVTLSAWGYMGGANTTGSNFVKGRIGDFDSNGFGAYTGSNESGTGSQHAFDNLTSNCGTGSGANGGTNPLSTANGGCGGSIEALYLDFGTKKVNITSVGIGYEGADADFLVFAWTGSGGPSMSTQAVQSNATGAGTLTGWTLVGGTDLDVTGTNPYPVGGTLYSSYFLITTYFGAAYSYFEMGDDQFKINSFTAQTCGGTLTGGNNGNGSTCGVPEPTSLTLVGFGLFAAVAARRRFFPR